MCAVKDGQILHTLELPLAGLISLKKAEDLAADSAKMKEANRELGLTEMENPLLRIVTLALPVIPEAKNVESPTNAKAAVSGSTRVTPCAMLMPAPMHRHVSTMSSGAALPSV